MSEKASDERKLWDDYWERQTEAAKKARTKRAKLDAIKRARSKR